MLKLSDIFLQGVYLFLKFKHYKNKFRNGYIFYGPSVDFLNQKYRV